jgi:hypothetical protein
MKLRHVAHSRTGDKGNTSNISLIGFDPKNYEFLRQHLAAEAVRAHFAEIVHGTVSRHEMPSIGALNFVMTLALGGGVTRSLALDAHGKSLGSALLDMELPDTSSEIFVLDRLCLEAAAE